MPLDVPFDSDLISALMSCIRCGSIADLLSSALGKKSKSWPIEREVLLLLLMLLMLLRVEVARVSEGRSADVAPRNVDDDADRRFNDVDPDRTNACVDCDRSRC